MNRYEKYKPTNIEWIGEVPEHWKVVKLKYIGEAIIGITYNPDDVTNGETGILVLRSSNIQNGKLAFEDCVYVNKEIKEKHLTRPGDVLLCARNGSAHLVGKSALITDKSANLTFGAFMTVFRSSFGEFAYQFFNSQIFKSQTSLFSTSTINQLTSETLNNLFVPLPTNEEQLFIANYLDEKIKNIDNLISNKQNLITLLKEERGTLITDAIRDKGRNWKKTKLKYIVSKIGSGVTPKGGANVYTTNGVIFLRSQNIYNDALRLDDVAYISDEIDEEMKNSRIEEGDVLLNITGASIGRCNFVPKNFGRGNVNQHVCIIRPIKSKITTEYLYLFLISNFGQTLIDYCQTGANREGLNFEQIKSFEIRLPNINEQNDIINEIRLQSIKSAETISKIEQEIRLIQEYKTILISEVVTGKIKVIA